jgi:hypothetical protein
MSEVVAPHYTLINTSRGSLPAVVVVNSALRDFDQRSQFRWHLRIEIECKELADRGMPTRSEGIVLYQLEDEIGAALDLQGNGIFAARITCNGHRELLYRIHDPEKAAPKLQQLIDNPTPLREWDFRMEEDPNWNLIQAELRLLEKDPKIN